MRRIQAGQAMAGMVNVANRLGPDRAIREWADWTDRVAAGQLPNAKPPRPQGVERNLVLTVWDWSDPKFYLHDMIATDRRKPTVNANGKIYGAHENSSDLVPVLDPVTHTASSLPHPLLDPKTPSHRSDPMTPSHYWGDEAIWGAQANAHNPMMDEKGRPWFTVRLRPAEQSCVLPAGIGPSIGEGVPASHSTRQACIDVRSDDRKFTLVDTCFPTHHLIFAEDADNTLWLSSGGVRAAVAGWINRRVLEETGDHRRAQGWSPFVLDTNGNGRRDDGWVEPNQPVDPSKDKRVASGFLQRRRQSAGRHSLGAIDEPAPGLHRALRSEDAAVGNLFAAAARLSAGVAPTSTGTACSGCRSRAAISASSTDASARCSTVRPRPAITVRKAGRCIACPGPRI